MASITSVDVYDSAHVIEALADDFETHGPPLVLRLDRIACQRTPDVHGYAAVQLGFEETPVRLVNRPEAGYVKKAGL